MPTSPPPLEILILAAGAGTRMRARLAKPLHPLGGAPMLAHVIATAQTLQPARIHIVFNQDSVPAAFADARGALNWVAQPAATGTGDAVKIALRAVAADAVALVLYADMPLLQADSIAALLPAAADRHLAILTVEQTNPTGYGRILRDAKKRVRGIVEERDATAAQRKIRECNTGVLAAPAQELRKYLANLDNRNAAGEFYLTDVVALAAADAMRITAIAPRSIAETFGVNSQAELARAERILQQTHAAKLLEHGVCLRDPARVDIRGAVQFGRDCVVDVNVIFAGEVRIGDGVRIGANCIIRDSEIGANSILEPNCLIENARIGAECRVGPFARLRPKANLGDRVAVGNFVEIKNSELGEASRANHLAYIGDAQVGAGANIGAGAITCNYDGAHKHRTRIGARAFIGSNAALVAPVEIGDGAMVGAGSTITTAVPAAHLAVTRAPQKNLARKPRRRTAK